MASFIMYMHIFDCLCIFHFISPNVPGSLVLYRNVCMYKAVVCARLGPCIKYHTE
jgi:hypothetical protein